MRSKLAFAVALSIAAPGLVATPVLAQKQGGTLRIYHRDNLPSASIHEEATISTVQPFMACSTIWCCTTRHKPQNTPETIVPDLATAGPGTRPRQADLQAARGREVARRQAVHRQGREVHLEQAHRQGPRRLPQEPAQAIWWQNLKEVTVNGDSRPPSSSTGRSRRSWRCSPRAITPVYPCHVSTKDMRTNPVGTGPFKFVELKRGESIKFVRNPDYWKKGKPYLDGIEWKIIPNRSTRDPGLRRRRVRHDVPDRRHHPAAQGRQVPGAEGRLRAGAHQRLHQPHHQSASAALQRCRDPPGDGARARPQGLHRHPERGQGRHRRRACCRRPRATGACRRRCWRRCPATGTDVEKNRAEARKIMEGLGYSAEQAAQGEGLDAQYRRSIATPR